MTVGSLASLYSKPILFAAIAPGLIQVVKLWAIVIIAICGIVAILYIILRVIGVSPPAWLINILWVILAVVIGIAAINLLVSLI